MALSGKKRERIELARRRKAINERSLNGKGYFFDSYSDRLAELYLKTGRRDVLDQLPDYRQVPNTRA